MTRLDTAADDNRHSIEEILDRTCESAGSGRASVRQAVESLGHVSHSALILVPAIIVVTPLSGIPGLSTICGLMIGLISMQGVLGRNHLWLPDWILRRHVDAGKLQTAIGYLRGPARFADRHTRQRFLVLVRPPARTALQAACMICGFAMPFLELVPFSSSILAAAVSFFATAIVTQDGVLAAIGLMFVAVAVAVAILAIA